MKSIPIFEIIGNSIKAVVKIFDNMYQEGWMLYFIVGLIALAIFIIIYN